MRERTSENIAKPNNVTPGDLQFQSQQQQQEQTVEKKLDNTNLAFIGDEECGDISTKYETNEQTSNKKNLADNSDGYFTTEEVDVDEELNNSFKNVQSTNSLNSETLPSFSPDHKLHQNSFISGKMISNFQNPGKKSQSNKQKSNTRSIFSFKKRKSVKKSEPRGRNNPLHVTDDLATPSIVLTPPTPSPKVSPVPPLNSLPEPAERPSLPSSKEESKTPRNGRKKKQPKNRFSSKNSADKSSKVLVKTSKRNGQKSRLDEKATPTEDAVTLNQDVIYHFKDDDDDPSEDVVILAEAVISPTEVFKPSEKSESDTKTSKRSLENESQCSPSKKKEKGIKKSKMFNIFNNNVKEAKREKGKRKVRKTPGESDDYLMTEADLKDSYINAHTSPLEDLDDSLEESPPLTNFRNLASNPDLAGKKI